MRAPLFFVWFVVVASCALIVTFDFIGFFFARSSSGPGAPLAGVANLYGLVFGLLAGAVLVVAWRFRPRALLTPLRLALSAVAYVLVLTVSFLSIRSFGTETLELRVLDPQQRPVTDATVSYTRLAMGAALSGALRGNESGSTQTDSSGRVTILAHRQHRITADITHPQFIPVTLTIDRDWGGGYHQAGVGWLDPRLTHRKGDPVRASDQRGAGFNLPDAPRLALTVYLPQPGIDRPLPYPTQ